MNEFERRLQERDRKRAELAAEESLRILCEQEERRRAAEERRRREDEEELLRRENLLHEYVDPVAPEIDEMLGILGKRDWGREFGREWKTTYNDDGTIRMEYEVGIYYYYGKKRGDVNWYPDERKKYCVPINSRESEKLRKRGYGLDLSTLSKEWYSVTQYIPNKTGQESSFSTGDSKVVNNIDDLADLLLDAKKFIKDKTLFHYDWGD